MTLVNITLNEEQQAFLLGIAGRGEGTFRPHVAIGIADLVQRARDASMFEEVSDGGDDHRVRVPGEE